MSWDRNKDAGPELHTYWNWINIGWFFCCYNLVSSGNLFAQSRAKMVVSRAIRARANRKFSSFERRSAKNIMEKAYLCLYKKRYQALDYKIILVLFFAIYFIADVAISYPSVWTREFQCRNIAWDSTKVTCKSRSLLDQFLSSFSVKSSGPRNKYQRINTEATPIRRKGIDKINPRENVEGVRLWYPEGKRSSLPRIQSSFCFYFLPATLYIHTYIYTT